MSTVERAQAILGDPSLVALKEWEGLNGEMGGSTTRTTMAISLS
ncbi:hypothetical protein [Ktedonobacter racemifer]|uniref:Uncharacterized protein n=1 Tax=Ktedonobacter racemifer DSM 44963 TaxID=485913 RepID=D6TW69_KTERA|nr:hypothetical protein [Ktedonobacter racemifer]EFH84452.1 hypothetical protein Krac_5495 [Ktedonobacter racemifer DSM 44963]